MNKRTIQKILSIVLALIVWQIAAMAVGKSFLFASPVEVARRLGSICLEDGFLSTVFFSLLRIMKGFLSAMIAGIAVGVLAGRFPAVEILLWPYVVAMKSVPVASFIILCLMWLNFSQLAVFISFLIVFPVIYSNVLQGYRNTDVKMLEMAQLYKVTWFRKFIYIYLPSMKPFIISSCTVSIGMAWKAGIAAEVIGVIKGSIGEMLYESKIYFVTSDLFAWTLIIIVLSILIEKIFLALLRLVFAEIEKL